MACTCKPGQLGPGKCDAEVSELVSRGDFQARAARPEDDLRELASEPALSRLSALERRYYEVLARLTALEAKVWATPQMVPLRASNEATEASKKARREADEKAMATEVEVNPEDWERGWLNL